MKLVRRHLHKYILDYFSSNSPKGLIIPGIIGCGKTTLVEEIMRDLKAQGYDLMRYEGDDVSFRSQIAQNSNLIFHEILEKGLEKPFVFIDEVQKETSIFDALKIAFDKGKASFIVTGSNPAFLTTTARDKLQRRADTITLTPFMLSEIFLDKGYLKKFDILDFESILFEHQSIDQIQLRKEKLTDEMKKIIDDFLIFGGLPEAFLSKGKKDKLGAVKLVAERGITQTFKKTVALDDSIRRYLALNNSREFTYKGLSQNIRQSKRDVVDEVIDHLMNHGYLLLKRPFLGDFEFSKTSYFVTYSWIDPGIVTYFTGDISPSEQRSGFDLEGYVQSVLNGYLQRVPLKTDLFYYKPFTYKKANDSLNFFEGEIDFIIRQGKRLVPLEVKKTSKLENIDTSLIEEFIRKHKLPYGIIIYGGAPFTDNEKKVIFYPYWLI